MKCRKLWIFNLLFMGVCADAKRPQCRQCDHLESRDFAHHLPALRVMPPRGRDGVSLMKYTDVQPRAVAIRQAVLSRTMPPWGAVKGFGDFRNDGGLSQAELELITDWVDSDTPKGNNPNVLPKEPKAQKVAAFKIPTNAIRVSGEFMLSQGLTLDGLIPESASGASSMKIVAVLPDGGTQPLLWLYEYKDAYRHPFLFREPVELPAGSVIKGVPADAKIALIPGKRKRNGR